MRAVWAFLLSSAALAQTAYVPPIAINIPSKVIPAQTITIVTSKNGGQVSFTVPKQTLTFAPILTTPVTAPVKIGPTDVINLLFACKGPDLQHLVCSAVPK